MRRVFALYALLGTLVAAVTGCVPIPVPSSRPSVAFGTEVAEESLRNLVLPGQTRRAVVARLGAPSYDLGSGQALVYPWTIDKGTVVILPLIPYASLGATAWDESSLFIVLFDVDDRVLKTGTAKTPLYTSVSGTARKWMTEQGLTRFDSPRNDASASAIVVYRRESPPCAAREHRIDPYSAFPPPVTLDGQAVGDVLKGEFLRLAVTPGEHTVAVDAIPAFRAHEFDRLVPVKTVSSPASLTLKVGSGQTIHLETWLCLAGTTPQTYQMYLELRDAQQAQAAVATLKSAWP